MPTTALATLDVQDYASLNLFDVAAWARPWERIPIGRTRTHVLEVARAQGISPWFANARDESVLVLDGDIVIQYKRPHIPAVAPGQPFAVRLEKEPTGTRMGWIRATRGHLARLPIGVAYEFRAIGGPGILLIQTGNGEHADGQSPDLRVNGAAAAGLSLDAPDIHAASGCANLVRAVNVFAHLARTEPSWTPSQGYTLDGSVIGLPNGTAITIPRFTGEV
jgi:hypothetical protein